MAIAISLPADVNGPPLNRRHERQYSQRQIFRPAISIFASAAMPCPIRVGI